MEKQTPAALEPDSLMRIHSLVEALPAVVKNGRTLLYLPHFLVSVSETLRSFFSCCVGIVITASPDGEPEPTAHAFHSHFDASLPAVPEGDFIVSFHPDGLPTQVGMLTKQAYTKGFFPHLYQWKSATLTVDYHRLRYEHFRNTFSQKVKHKLPPSDLPSSVLPGWEALIGFRTRALLSRKALRIDPQEKKILMVTKSLRNGGAERQLVTAVQLLKENTSFDINLLCKSFTDGHNNAFHLPSFQELGVPVFELGDFSALTSSVCSDALRELCVALRALPVHHANETLLFALAFMKLRPEIVHIWLDNIHAALAAALTGVPRIILFVRSLSLATHAATYLPALPVKTQARTPYDPSMRPIVKELLRSGGVSLCCNSHAAKYDYANWLSIPKESIKVIHNGIDDVRWQNPGSDVSKEYRQRFGIPDGVRVVGSLYRLTSTKDPGLWLKTAACIAARRHDVVFVVFGDGAERQSMLQQAEELGLSGRLFMPGVTQEVAAALSMMDVVLLTSRIESTPNALIEAQLLGVPVVAGNIGGIAETMMHGVTGWLIDSRNPEDFAERVLYVMQDDVWRETASRFGPAFIKKQFSKEVMWHKVVAMYQKNSPAAVGYPTDS